ncbi:uncharacterized protein Z518_05886 [Rhinocladiella mackenziei CBS 650.93]|uniref:C2H2-type domain-containing protein n=1 Tax=Rhinocladiella mackenziei CBS 650.93 TaxID=1442369 RepID=A0A0D2IGZ1_9EURO|nr:uncharacterized protein Z518_05886 [Rhinocladiella mackenziei CBS 650.93]KIX05014.1 hypothetical protein Z518_05886 [Rhinocladiella mackenziei CBS 650.93]
MDVQTHPREARIFSILNDNDCPSFVIPKRQPSPTPSKSSVSSSPRQRAERPTLQSQPAYARTSSFSSTGSPPLLRLSSSSSKSSSSSMDSSPSPVTPTYNYMDSTLQPYDLLIRQDMAGYLQSPIAITPILEQQMLIVPNMPDPYSSKPITPTQHPIAPAPLHPLPHLPAGPPSHASVPPPPTSAPSSLQSRTSPARAAAPSSTKKNKYPCPYAQSHNCQATFTTSGHAARHGKKHTGEKGVHCPVCDKAFTRKDNMKQHERTHKNSTSARNSDDSTRRSKAAITKDAQKAKQPKKADATIPDTSRRSSLIHSPLSEVTSLAPTAIETPLNGEDPTFYSEPSRMFMPIQTIPEGVSPNSLYPPLSEDSLLAHAPDMQVLDKSADLGTGSNAPMPPATPRGFSDLDTLAQAAESFNPYYQQGL